LEAPEPDRLGQAARTAKSLGLERLVLPVIEECLFRTPKARVQYLDGLVRAMDRIHDGGLGVWLMAPARRVLGLDWAPPYLVRAVQHPRGRAVFVDGKVSSLRPFEWWKDPSIVQNRIRLFRDLVSAVQGHPALDAWIVLDRFLEWAHPDPQVAGFVFKAFLSEIREKDEQVEIHLGLGLSDVLNPKTPQVLAEDVDGLRIGGLDGPPLEWHGLRNMIDEQRMAAYLGALCGWLFEKPAHIELGWGLLGETVDLEEWAASTETASMKTLQGISWLNLVEPEPQRSGFPPWSLSEGLPRVGLLDPRLEPKPWVESWIDALRRSKEEMGNLDFIDIEREDYVDDPATHFTRLWDHFRVSRGAGGRSFL